MSLSLRPVIRDVAFAFVRDHHRHRKIPPASWLFGIGLETEAGELVGVVVIGRPSARPLQDGYTAEVTRLCVLEGARNACSKLYAAAWRACRAMGYRRLITYTLRSESGASLRASGFAVVAQVRARSKGWDTPIRRRDDQATGAKLRWQMTLEHSPMPTDRS